MLDITDNLRCRQDGAIHRTWCGTTPTTATLVVAGRQGDRDILRHRQRLAKEYGYWLGDAFASGGSVGYDHKAMGITARGAWVAVQRHFRERGVRLPDAKTSPVSASAT
ncbi:MAG: NAD-glutamate dehydrogenase domain-containing protein [Nocardioidaceae bacterium]